MDPRQKRRRRLEQLRQRFVAATLRTRSLRLRRTTRRGALDLSRLARKDEPAFDRIIQRLGDDSDDAVPLCDIQPVDELESFEDDVGVIAHAAREQRLETGCDDLAVGWPFLEGATDGGTWIRAPLLLFPAAVSTSEEGRMQWVVQPTGPAGFNEPLVEFLAREQSFRMSFDELFGDRPPAVDDDTWARLASRLHELGLPLDDAPQQLPALRPVELRTGDQTESAPPGAFALVNHVVLGRFSVSSSNVIVDYDEMLEQRFETREEGLAPQLLQVDEDAPWEEEEPLEDRDDDETERILGDWQRWQVFASDTSQDAVFQFIEEADDPEGLVVQGPPGTGKSQLITNLVGAAIARNQRVLVVCSKRAGLDVVASRLQTEGLDEPLAVVHDVSRDRNDVCASIEATLAQLEDHLDGADERHRQVEQARRNHQKELTRLGARLQHSHDAFELLGTSRNGKPPLAELYERALDDDGRVLPDMQPVADEVTEDELFEALPRIETLAGETAPLAEPHPLAIRGRFEQFDADDFDELFEAVDELHELVEDTRRRTGATMDPQQSAEYDDVWSQVEPLVDMLEYGEALLDEFLLFWTWTDGRTETGEWQRVMEILEEARRHRRVVPHELILVDRETLETWIDELNRLAELQQKWFRFFLPEWWRLRELPGEIMELCESWNEKSSQLPVDIVGACREAIQWQELIEAMPDDNPLFEFGFSGHPDDIDRAIESLQRQHDHIRCVHDLREALADHGGPYQQLPAIDAHIGDPVRDVGIFHAAVDDRALARNRARVAELIDELEADGALDPVVCDNFRRAFDRGDYEPIVERLDAFLQAREEVEDAVRVDRMMSDEPRWVRHFLRRWQPADDTTGGAGDDVVVAVERGWRAVLTADRDPAEVEASLVDPEYLQRLAEDLKRCRQVAGEGVHGRYVERIAEAAGDDNRRRALQKLAAEVAKRRNKPSLRQLTEQFWDRGLSLIRPVWFCSPEAVSALFPLESELFDLVIFDEASQCPVEAALPALVRSQSAVIAGDDQQMPPTRFFRAGFDPKDPDSTLLSTRSVLQLSRAVFTNTTLRWHYRSRHEELIAFSNRAFYGGRLVTAPVAEKKRAPDVEGLHFAQVDGLWEDRQNRAEAERVVELVDDLLTSRSLDGQTPSVGVVTFNRNQAELVEHIIDARAADEPRFRRALKRDEKRPGVEQLFIRNLENVQGDQRDVIIISPGYGPTEPGGPIHARFGPVSQKGGEKRLNVAITRARLGLWLVTSMHAEALDVDHTRNVGPKLLQAYLGFVEAHSRGDDEGISRWLDEAQQLGGGEGVTGRSRRRTSASGPGSRVREQLAAALEQRGLVVRRDVGLGSHCLDLTVRRSRRETARLGVDCTEFLRDPDALGRDVHSLAFWQRLGWTVIRVTPRMWLDERDATLETVVDALGDTEARSASAISV